MQTDKHTNKTHNTDNKYIQTDIHTRQKTDIQTYRPSDNQTDIHTYIYTDNTNEPKNRQTEQLTD